MLRFQRRLARLVILAACIIALAGCGSIHRGYDSFLVLNDLQSGDDSSRLQATTATPERTTLDYTMDGRTHVADIYRPTDRAARATLVLIHGFTEEGRRDPRLVEFADAMARVGFVVIAPDVEGPRTLSVGMDDARSIRDSLAYALRDPDDLAEPPVGLMAFSFAVGPALIASMQPGIAGDLGFVVAVGGYYDLDKAITYVTTGMNPYTAEEHGMTAARRQSRWVVLLSQLDRLDRAADRERLRTIAERRMATPGADVSEQVSGLSEDGRAVYALVTNTDPERVPALLDALPADVRAEIRALDLARRDLSALEAELVLIHGTQDRVIPIGHSRQLQDVVGDDQAHLYPASGLYHVEVSPGLYSGWQLWRAGYRILTLADDNGE